MGHLLRALAVLLVLASPAGAVEVTKKSLSFEVVVGPADDVRCTVVADLYTPVGTTKANPAPAILATNGFGGSKNDFVTLGPAFASRGYVFLAYSGLGFGGSGCKIQLDDPDWDGKAGSQLVSFLGGTKAALDGTAIDYVTRDGPGDPRVGMIGGSYGGQIQFAIAGIDPRLDTIVPQITWNDLSYSLIPNNADFERGVTSRTPGVAKIDWPVLFFGVGTAQGIQAAFADQSHISGACVNFDDRVCPSLIATAALGYPQQFTIDLLRHASVATYSDRIRIPTFLSQGQSDTLFNLQEAVATYRALFAQGTPVKMLWRSAGHSGGGLGRAEWDSSSLESAYESRMALEWLDFWLRGIGDPPALDFSFIRDWAAYSGDAAPAVGSTPTYPAGRDETLYLSGGDALVRDRGAVESGSPVIAALPGGLTGSGNGYADVPVPDAPATAVTFSTPPLASDLDVVGVPRLTLKVSAPTFEATQGQTGGKLVLFARLVDFDPASGESRLPRNQLSAVRIPDVTQPLTIELPGLAHRFKAGHRVQLALSTSNSTNRGNLTTGPVTVAVDPAAPSTLVLPRLGAQAGGTGSGPSGTTPFEAAPGAPAPRKAVRPAFARPAAKLPRRCRSRRNFIIRLQRPPRGDRIRSARVTLNGKRVRVIRGRRHRARIDLRGRRKGVFRVVVTLRTRKGRVLRSARTYHTCVPGRRRR